MESLAHEPEEEVGEDLYLELSLVQVHIELVQDLSFYDFLSLKESVLCVVLAAIFPCSIFEVIKRLFKFHRFVKIRNEIAQTLFIDFLLLPDSKFRHALCHISRILAIRKLVFQHLDFHFEALPFLLKVSDLLFAKI